MSMRKTATQRLQSKFKKAGSFSLAAISSVNPTNKRFRAVNSDNDKIVILHFTFDAKKYY